MKRCPACDFTFADDHQFCDFDHTELTDLPEKPPTFPKVPVPGRARRMLHSRVGLTILAVSAVAMSALLVGYLDSASDSRSDLASAPHSQSSLKRQVQPSASPRKISTQRKLAGHDTDPSMPSSILKWNPNRASSERSSKTLRRIPVPARRNPRAHIASARRPAIKRTAPSHIASTIRPAVKPVQPIKVREAPLARNNETTPKRTSTYRQPSGKGNKVVAFFKKTGSILSKPFRW